MKKVVKQKKSKKTSSHYCELLNRIPKEVLDEFQLIVFKKDNGVTNTWFFDNDCIHSMFIGDSSLSVNGKVDGGISIEWDEEMEVSSEN